MKSHVVALAALVAIGFSGAAFAGEVTKGAIKPAVMSDSELDNVTAAGPIDTGLGTTTAAEAGGLNFPPNGVLPLGLKTSVSVGGLGQKALDNIPGDFDDVPPGFGCLTAARC